MTHDILATGSSGNCVILNSILSLDMGVAFSKVAPHVRDLQMVWVSHQHGDHFRASTIRKLALERPSLRFCGGPFLAKQFVQAGVSPRNLDVLEAGKRYDYGAFQIEPFGLYHDVPCCGLKIYMGGEKAFFAVDTGTLTGIEAKDFDLYLLENNHLKAEIEQRIAEKQAAGEFAYEYRAAKYHLSEEQAMEWLVENVSPERWPTTKIVFLHQHKEKE